mmetsp:Transcript_1776/g.3185  ORF Transcript_1776/g.3185 Transcript_1776/m.3185 type:complete len:96 (+) Transcript_1776:49-336(+)
MDKSENCSVYVGGFDYNVDERFLFGAFITFGNILSISLPLNTETGLHRNFAFIHFESPNDAKSAIDNMNDSEFFGKRIHVNFANPLQTKSNFALE